MRRAFAFKMNRVSVAGSGNTGTSTVPYPARFANTIIAVGATDYQDLNTSYSKLGVHGRAAGIAALPFTTAIY